MLSGEEYVASLRNQETAGVELAIKNHHVVVLGVSHNVHINALTGKVSGCYDGVRRTARKCYTPNVVNQDSGRRVEPASCNVMSLTTTREEQMRYEPRPSCCCRRHIMIGNDHWQGERDTRQGIGSVGDTAQKRRSGRRG